MLCIFAVSWPAVYRRTQTVTAGWDPSSPRYFLPLSPANVALFRAHFTAEPSLAHIWGQLEVHKFIKRWFVYSAAAAGMLFSATYRRRYEVLGTTLSWLPPRSHFYRSEVKNLQRMWAEWDNRLNRCGAIKISVQSIDHSSRTIQGTLNMLRPV